jgi:hypothetical protein
MPTFYTLQNTVGGEPMAWRLTEDGRRTGIYRYPWDLHGVPVVEHNHIIATLVEQGYQEIQYLSPEAFDDEADRRTAAHLGISVEAYRAL